MWPAYSLLPLRYHSYSGAIINILLLSRSIRSYKAVSVTESCLWLESPVRKTAAAKTEDKNDGNKIAGDGTARSEVEIAENKVAEAKITGDKTATDIAAIKIKIVVILSDSESEETPKLEKA